MMDKAAEKWEDISGLSGREESKQEDIKDISKAMENIFKILTEIYLKVDDPDIQELCSDAGAECVKASTFAKQLGRDT